MKPPGLARWIVSRAVSRNQRCYFLSEVDAEFERVVFERGRWAGLMWYWREALFSVKQIRFFPFRPATSSRKNVAAGLRRSITQAARSLRRQPLFAVGVVGTLALGVSATNAVFSFAQPILLRPLPFPNAQQLVALSSFSLSGGLDDRDISGPDFFDIASQSTVFRSIGAYEIAPVSMRNRDGFGEKIDIARTTPSLFQILGVDIVAGRTLLSEEVGVGSPRHTILSVELAVELFGGSENATGATISLDGESFLVVGVARKQARLDLTGVDAWVPLPYGHGSLRRAAGVLKVVGRLDPDVSQENVATELERIAMGLEDRFPDSNLRRRFVATPLTEVLSVAYVPAVVALTFAVSLLLLIAIINASGLMLVRLTRRATEFRIRAAIGAVASDLRLQLAMEGVLLGAAAGLLSVGGGWLLLRAAESVGPGLVPGELQLGPASMVVSLMTAPMAACVATVVALFSTRSDSDLHRRTSSRRANRTRSILLVGQLASTMVLLVCVSLLGRSLTRLVEVDPGFTPDRLVAAAVDLPDATYPTDMSRYPRWPAIHRFYDLVTAEAEAIPSASAAAVAWHHPLKRGWQTRILPEGAQEVPVGEREMVNIRSIGTGYLDVVDATLLMGRDIAPTDDVESERVALINRALERQFFPNTQAVGKRIQFFGEWWRVVGVIADFKSHGLALETRPAVFPSIKQMPSETVHVLVRSADPAADLLSAVQRAVWRVDPQLAPYDLVVLDDVIGNALAGRRLLALLFGWLGAIALVLAAMGLVGTVLETIVSRRRELGLRAALGANPTRLFGYVLQDSVFVVLVGVSMGLVGALVSTRFIANWLFETSRLSGSSYGIAAVAVAGVAFIACAIPALKIARVDPSELLERVSLD